MKAKVYEYKACSTCQKAIRYLDAKKIEYDRIPIVEKPPQISELRQMLSNYKDNGGSIKNLFNTSGQLYREMEISQKLKDGMSDEESLKLLSIHGKLVKRPFLIIGKKGTVGFKSEDWEKLFS